MYPFFYSLISLVIALFFILMGIISILIPWSNSVRHSLIQFLNDDTLTILLFGFSFLVIGLILLVSISQFKKRRYYTIRSGDHSLSVDVKAIEDALKFYWQKHYPDKDIPYHVQLNNNKIHITADLPQTSLIDQKFVLNQLNTDLKELLVDLIGYKDEFKLSVSFAN